MNKFVEILINYIAIPFCALLAGIYLSGEVWAKGKIVLGDILKFLGWAGKGVRKLSIKSEYEGTINSIVRDYNKNFESPILPDCKIEWVTEKNTQNILRENEAIICLSFNKKDHHLNFLNATLNFVQTALIPKAKDYLTVSTSTAIDLLTTHIILRNNRKDVLTTFRKKLNEFDDATKEEFDSLVPTNDRGLFLNILLPEFHFYGELVDILPPCIELNTEANGFVRWFKELATREIDHKTNLKYTSKNFKVGVILVGKDETWENQGPAAYTKWADYYSSENYNSIYILGRGNSGYERATTVKEILVNDKGFEQQNKNPQIKCYSNEGHYIVTCYSLRPNKATIAFLAWENLKDYYKKDEEVPAIVDSVQTGSLIVNAFGLKFEITNKLISEIEIKDAKKFFRSEDEIYLKIIELDVENQHAILSNIGTTSDPKQYIDAILNEKNFYRCTIEKIQTDKQGIQTGLKASNEKLHTWIYIPKNKATFSRFLDLNLKFHIGKVVDVEIERFNPTAANFIGAIKDLIDPWETPLLKSLQHDQIIDVKVKQINEFSIVCEFEEGIECCFSRQEISWNPDECITTNFNIDDNIKVKIISINAVKRKIEVSIKRISKTPELKFFEENANKIVDVEVIKVVPEKGIVVKYPGGLNTGFIHWFEIGWGAIGKFEHIFKEGDKINAFVLDFNSERNSVKFSIKHKYRHQFDEWAAFFYSKSKDIPVQGQVIGYFENSVHIELQQNDITVQAFILKKNISNLQVFVENYDIPFFLPIGKKYHFHILEINKYKKTISLTRIKYLTDSKKPEYGEKIKVSYVKQKNLTGYFYSDEIEGWTIVADNNINIGSTIYVMPISHSKSEYEIDY